LTRLRKSKKRLKKEVYSK